jgi:photosystem II stability/assembly factor-like uncharacterized protein
MVKLRPHLDLAVFPPAGGFASWLVRSAVCLLLVAPGMAQTASWNREQSGTLSWLHAVFFLDQNHGWAAGSRGTLLRTLDGGQSWQARSASTRDQVRDIFFLDEQNGWLVCEVSIYELKTKEQPRAYLMRTTDGGDKWKRVEIKGLDIDSILLRAVFSRGGRGWAFGEAGAIYTTRDAGGTWSRLPSPTTHLLLGGVFIDDDRGWIVGAGATIIQTSDGGDTWYQSRLPQVEKTVRFTSASFIDNRIGWAVGSGGNIYQTTNGGRTWKQQQSGVDVDLFDVKFLDAHEGWAVGAEGTIIHTVDGGVHWTSERPVTEHPLERVFFSDKSHGWAVGFGGTVLAYFRS